MRTTRTRSSITPRASLSTLGLAGLVGIGWAWDAWRRDRAANRLHRTLVDLLLNALHSGDARTERHSRRVADLTDPLARSYGLGDDEHARLRVAALLHDLGKIDNEVFDMVHSSDRLSDDDRQTMEGHSGAGADILRPLDRIHPGIAGIVEAHHERWDGMGYPKGRRGDEIPLEARILSAADVFDALTQPRSYHDPLTTEHALENIRRSSGRRFDPEVVRRVNRPDVLRRWEEIVARGRADERAAAHHEADQAVAT